jgi:uncharacterized protein (UPF0332 family)
MAYHDDLLAQAFMLVHHERRKPKQASLRLAVSTAYYSLFQLLINEAVANWKHGEQRAALGRAFDHGSMKTASNRLQDTRQFPFSGENPVVVADLRFVAKSFAQLQEQRHAADYDNARFWTKTEAFSQAASAERAFMTWKRIRKERIAQDYLISLLVRKRD